MTAACEPGDTVLAGGHYVGLVGSGSSPVVGVVGNYPFVGVLDPTPETEEWGVTIAFDEEVTIRLTVYAICLDSDGA